MFNSGQFGIVVTPLKDPKQMPEVIEQTLLQLAKDLSQVGRAFASHDVAHYSATDNVKAFRVQADMYGWATGLARLLACDDRLSPLHPSIMPDLTPELTKSAQGIIYVLRRWFENLPPLTMTGKAREALFVSVQRAEEITRAMPNALDSEIAKAIRYRTEHLLPGVAELLGLDEESCQGRIIVLATQVMPVWHEWLGGIEPTDLPQI